MYLCHIFINACLQGSEKLTLIHHARKKQINFVADVIHVKHSSFVYNRLIIHCMSNQKKSSSFEKYDVIVIK